MSARRAILTVTLLFTVGVAAAFAQGLYSVETRPPRGFMPTADQLSSPVDHIEPVSGKLHLEIPLASLSAGRAGIGFDVNLVYDSHEYDVLPSILQPIEPYTELAEAYQLSSQATTGGWNYNFDNYRIEVESRSDTEFAPPQYCSQESWSKERRVYRLRVGLADGSLHTMYLKGHENSFADGGFFEFQPSGTRGNACPPLPDITGWQSYYSTDGSYLRFEILADGQPFINQAWSLYFPDGKRLTGHGTTVEALYDANGNGIYFQRGCHDGACNRPYLLIHDDTLNETGRQILVDYNVTDLPFGGGSNRVDQITTQGPQGPMTWTVNWASVSIQPKRYEWSDAPWHRYSFLYLGGRSVKYVQLPLAPPELNSETPPPVWNSYAFGYSDDSVGGYGEVSSMRTPSGSVFQYRWALEGAVDPYWSSITQNRVTQRRIIVAGEPDLIWTHALGYAGGESYVRIVGPDSGETKYFYGPPTSYLDAGGPFLGFSNLVYRIEEPYGKTAKRLWAANKVPMPAEYQENNAYVKRETHSVGSASAGPTLTAVMQRTVDKNGNLIETIDYDWVPVSESGPETGSSINRVRDFYYYAEVPVASSTSDDPDGYWNPQFDGLPRRVDAVRRMEVRDAAWNIVAVTEFEYDDAYRAGNVTVERRWDNVKAVSPPALGQLNAANSVVFTRSYDTFGNLEDIFDPPVAINGPLIHTHIVYHPSRTFPTNVHYAYQTPEQRAWSYGWHVPSGALISKTDVSNNVTTFYSYDEVGRLEVVDEAGLRKTITDYQDPNSKIVVTKDLATFGDGKVAITTEYDQLGRVKLTRMTEPGNTDGIKVKTAYYSALNTTVQSSPYRTTGDTTLEWTCTQSDASERIIAVAMFKGSNEPPNCGSAANRTGITTTAYEGNTTTVTDPAGRARREVRDSLGRLIQVHEDPSDLNYQTQYSYDALDNLTQVNQGVQTRIFQYSSLGRLTWARNPESGTDAEGHSITYTYYDSGDLATRKDARGVIANFTYDPLRRIRTKTYTNDPQLTPTVTYNYYTSGAPNVGHLQSVISSAATTTYTNYDDLGRVRGSTHGISGYATAQSFHYDYWLNDGVKSIQYPSGRVVNYDVDDAGRINKVRDAQTTFADLTNIASPFSAYTADGRISAMRLGNELWETRDYQTPGTATKYKVGTGLGDNQLLELEYNFSGDANNGNLVSHVIRNNRFNPVRTWSQRYSYDALNRIACVAEAATSPQDPCAEGDWRQTFGYDRYGNRWVSWTSGLTGTDVHEPTVETNFDSNTNRLQGSTYDAAGNQTLYTPYTLEYDAENRNVSVNSPSNGGGTFTYDGDGNRVKKTWTNSSGTTTTYYFRNALGQLAVEYSSESSPNPGRVYVHTDMLGSTRLVTGDKPANWPSSTASILECYDYVPFGRMLNSGDALRNTGCYPPNPDYELSSNLPQKFTGKERDAETRLDYFGARYLSAAQGRFIAADPLMASAKASLPQTWNRYAYALNNPLRFVDPDGMEVPESCIKDLKCQIEVKLNVIWDSTMHNGKGLTAAEKRDFEKNQLEKAKRDYGRSNIKLAVEYTEGKYEVAPDGSPQIAGLDESKLNIVVSNGTPVGGAGASGMLGKNAVSFININRAIDWNWTVYGMNTTEHELGHQFLGHVGTRPAGAVDAERKEILVDMFLKLQSWGSVQSGFREGIMNKRYAVPVTPEANKPKQ